MASFELDNPDLDPAQFYYNQAATIPPPVIIPPPITETSTVVTTVNGESGPVISISAAPGTGYVFNGTVFNVNDAATVRSSISAAQSGVNTDITELNGASQVDVSSDYKVNGVQVVTDQQPAIPNPTGGVTIDVEGRAATVLLLNAMRAHGLIDT